MFRTKSSFFYQQNYCQEKDGKKKYGRYFVEDVAEFEFSTVAETAAPIAFLVKEKDDDSSNILEKEIRYYEGHLYQKSKQSVERIIKMHSRRHPIPSETHPPEGEYRLTSDDRQGRIYSIQYYIEKDNGIILEKNDGSLEVWYPCKIPTYVFNYGDRDLYLKIEIEFLHLDYPYKEFAHKGYLPTERKEAIAMAKRHLAKRNNLDSDVIRLHDLENEIICLMPDLCNKYANIRQRIQRELCEALDEYLFALDVSDSLNDAEKQSYQQVRDFKDYMVGI